MGGWPVGSPRGFALPLCARGLIAQRAAALVSAATLVSAARGGRLEGSREREVGGELHRAGVLRAAVAPLVEGEAGLRCGLAGLRAALVEGAAARDATLALVGRADRQRVFVPREALYLLVNVVFVVFPPQQGDKGEGEMARGRSNRVANFL